MTHFEPFTAEDRRSGGPGDPKIETANFKRKNERKIMGFEL